MDVRTYRARSIQDALRLIRDDLGPDAAVLHTREVNAGMLGGIFGGRQIEVTASTEVQVPSRLPQEMAETDVAASNSLAVSHSSYRRKPRTPIANTQGAQNEFRSRLRENLHDDEGLSLLDQRAPSPRTAAMFKLLTDLVDAGIPDTHARELLDTVKRRVDPRDADDSHVLKAQACNVVEEQLKVRGQIRVSPSRCNVVALVGPTGVGKTTTIAKLAASFRLKERIRVGLITVDTFRIAAVEQLRTYAEIMDLPMEVVATPREMQAAVERMSDLDLVLIDTAGRSPRDESHMQELRATLADANPDEVHLVLSSVTSAEALQRNVEQFRDVGASHMLLTKIDEAVAMGSLFPLLKRCDLPVTYITNGQSVPNDIFAADKRKLAKLLLGE
jgi:flagellar biosynthesis protein FlhF